MQIIQTDQQTAHSLAAITTLHDLAKVRPLRTEAIWRLHRAEARVLSDRADAEPAGGWRAFTALAVGTGCVAVAKDSFITGRVNPAEEFDDVDDVRRALVESFTRYLMPPAVAASLFLTLGIHPLWGLRIARKLHVESPMLNGPVEGWRDEALLPDENLNAIAGCLQDFLCDLMTFLANTPPTNVDDLSGFVADLCDTHRDHLQTITVDRGLSVLVDELHDPGPAQHRAAERLSTELLRDVLIPAGVARRVNDSLQVDCDLLASSIVDIDQLADGEG